MIFNKTKNEKYERNYREEECDCKIVTLKEREKFRIGFDKQKWLLTFS
jgi:hypothetical protein